MEAKLEQSHYVQNLVIERCPVCGHKWYSAGKWNTRKGKSYVSHLVYCVGCKHYFKASVVRLEITNDEAREFGYSIAV